MEDYLGLDFEKENKIKKVFDSIDEVQESKHKALVNSIALDLIPDYVWNKDLGTIATNLIHYFAGLEKEYNLNKSIALTGTYGVGKSRLMRIFQNYIRKTKQFNHPNIFRIISIEDVIQGMTSDEPINSEILYNCNTSVDRPAKKPANLLINEFGYQYGGKSFGTEYKELIEMFLMKRYDIFQEYGKMTHVTMNFDTEDLAGVFPPKIIDRFKEMFNIIPLDGKSFRK